MDLLRVVMMGTGTFAEPTLEALLNGPHPVVGVFTQPDRETGAKRGSTRQVGRGIKEIAAEKGVPVFQPEKINDPDGRARLRGLHADLLVVAAYGQILSAEVLNAARLGAINVHASLLPKYRGAAPVAYAILNGETITGVTIIRMSIGLDAGEMLARAELPIRPDETAGELEARLAPIGAELAVAVVDRLARGPVSGTVQDKSLVTRAPKLRKEDGLIDWTAAPEAVRNRVRAMQPWPTPYTYFHRIGKEPMRLIITKVVPIDVSPEALPSLTPGKLRNLGSGRLGVEVGGGIVEILELQPAGKKKMAAAEFLRGYPILGSERVGPEVLDL